MNKHVIIYTSSICSMCSMLPAYLENLGIEYTENGVDIHPEEGMNIVAKTEKITIPQLCINDV